MLSVLLQVHILYGILCFCISSISCSDESDELEKLWINGGENATFGEFKYAALLGASAANYWSTCTGFLIYDRFVLTAGHCVSLDLKSIKASFRTDEDKMSSIKAKKWHRHEQYERKEANYDIGLIELESSATDLPGVEIATLPTSDELPPLGSFVIIVGYGKEYVRDCRSERFLKKATMKVSNSCGGTKHCLSATVGSGSACPGDSGGPVVFENKVIALSYAMANTKSCKGVSAFFTTIFPFMEWINEKMVDK